MLKVLAALVGLACVLTFSAEVWRSSHQSPPYYERYAHRAQIKNERQTEKKWEWGHADPGVTFVTFCLVLVAGVQAALFIIQLRYMRTGLRDAEIAAKAATMTANAVVDNERPWVGPITTSSKQITPGQFIDATVVIQNSGHTPALDMRAAFKGSIKSKTVSPDEPDIARAPPKALFPNVPDWYYPFSKNLILSREDFDAIRDGDKIVWIIGRIEYLDNRRGHRYTNICTRWDQSRGVFVPHETGNDATKSESGLSGPAVASACRGRFVGWEYLMSITDRVSEWLQRQQGKSFCDACIATQLGLQGRRAVWRASKFLAARNGFQRGKGPCPVCHKNRIVIRAV